MMRRRSGKSLLCPNFFDPKFTQFYTSYKSCEFIPFHLIFWDKNKIFYELLRTFFKVEVGSAMYKEGIRWTETFGRTDITTEALGTQHMVLDFILTISLRFSWSLIIDNDVSLVMLIIIIISQVLGHTKVKKALTGINLFSLNEVTMKS